MCCDRSDHTRDHSLLRDQALIAGVMKPSDRSDHARDYSVPKLATVITVTGKSQSDSHEQNKKT